MLQAWNVGRHVLCLEGEVFRDDSVRDQAVEDAGMRRIAPNENANLKKLLAQQMPDMAAMKELLSEKW